MSHQEQHPLDERFRQVLQHAEVTPPPAVWEAVKRARDGGRRKAGWWRWSFPALAVLLFTGLTATYFAMRTPSTVEEQAEGLATDHGTSQEQLLIADADMQEGSTAAVISVADERSPTTTDRTEAKKGPDAYSTTKPASAKSTSPAPKDYERPAYGGTQAYAAGDRGSSSASSGPLTANVAFDPTVPNPTESPAADDLLAKTEPAVILVPADDRGVDRLLVRVPGLQYTTPAALPNSAPKPAAYLLPHGEWWLAPVVGVYSVHDQWRGDDQNLVQALDQATGTTTAWAFGLAAGRQWRSGFGLSTGLFTERSESQLYHSDTRVQVEQEITTYLVTLNTQVFVSDADTITTVITDDRSSSGVQSRTAWRVPVDLHKRWSLGRWQLGLHGGFALEWTTAEGATLIAADAEGGLVAADPGAAELRARYPTALLGSVGAELGWMLNERWTLWVDPVYMGGLSALSPTSDAYTLPQRWGLQFGLAHHFLPSRSK
jgi:hypothetical protein